MPIGARGVGHDRIPDELSINRLRRWKRVAIGVSVALHMGLLMTVFWNPDDPAGPVTSPRQAQPDIQVSLIRMPPRPPSQPAPATEPKAATPPPSIVARPRPAAPQHRAKPVRPTPAPVAPAQVAEAAPAAQPAPHPNPAASHEPPLVLHPRFRSPPIPAVYPPRALELNQQGDVLVRALINADGEPETVNLWRGSGFPLLDAAALDAVRRWRFLPAQIDGVAVTAIVQVPVIFHLK